MRIFIAMFLMQAGCMTMAMYAFIDENDILLPHLFSIRAASHSKKWGDYRYYTPNYRELIIHGARVLEILHDCNKPVCCFNVRSDWYPETQAF